MFKLHDLIQIIGQPYNILQFKKENKSHFTRCENS